MRPGNEKAADNTLCIGKGFEEVWAYSRPAGPCFLCCVPVQNKKQRLVITDPPLLAHTSAFSSRQTVFGKLMTFSARRNMHMDIIPMHISHIIMVTVRFMFSFPPSVVFPFAVFRSGWWHNTPSARRCQPFFRLSAFFPKNLQRRYVISSKLPFVNLYLHYVQYVVYLTTVKHNKLWG